MIDAEKSLKDYVKGRFKCNAEFADAEVQRAFNSKDIILSIIKCSCSFNYFGARNAIINENISKDECPR